MPIPQHIIPLLRKRLDGQPLTDGEKASIAAWYYAEDAQGRLLGKAEWEKDLMAYIELEHSQEKKDQAYERFSASVGLNVTGVDSNDCATISLEVVCQILGTNQPTGTKNFVLPPGITGTTATVLGEDRTIPISSGAFTDTFDYEYTHHIYQITQ